MYWNATAWSNKIVDNKPSQVQDYPEKVWGHARQWQSFADSKCRLHFHPCDRWPHYTNHVLEFQLHSPTQYSEILSKFARIHQNWFTKHQLIWNAIQHAIYVLTCIECYHWWQLELSILPHWNKMKSTKTQRRKNQQHFIQCNRPAFSYYHQLQILRARNW